MSTSLPTQRNVFQNYQPPPHGYDEFFTNSGETWHHVVPFINAINAMGQNEFARRWQQSVQMVHENGFAYSGYGSPKDQPRPWELDALPLLVSPREWNDVSGGLKQRARLLNLILNDVYSEQTLLTRGLLPRELIFCHPGFLLPFHGQANGQKNDEFDDRMLQFYAADLARTPDGKWTVLENRTEAPSGLGFALENRLVLSRMLPDVFAKCQVHRLAPFFMSVQETLRRLAPDRRDYPHVVLLTQGPSSRNYFEDAFLARYLGYTLVEGGDLAVRNQQLMLKTLGGLVPVDVIFRRQNSSDCDPLELDPYSALGIAGLMQVIRAGNVVVANGLGSGLVESACFMAFMPKLCQELLGEDLKLPGVKTWWCGDPDSLTHVLRNLDDLTIQPAFRRRGISGAMRESLVETSRDKLVELIRSNPRAYVAQEKVIRSTAPDWKQELKPTHLVLRSYVVSSEDDSYEVMPGGLARTSVTLDPLEMSLRKGEGSKDAWVLSDEPVKHVSLLSKTMGTIELRRGGADLPSRVADNLFWLGRQLERAESLARILRSLVHRLTGESISSSTVEVPVLLRCLAEQGQVEPGYAVNSMRGQLSPIDQVLPAVVFDSSNSASLRCLLDELFRLGLSVRDRISDDTWRIIQHIDEGFQLSQNQNPPGQKTTNQSSFGLTELLSLLDELIIRLAGFSGMVRESMTRTQAYRFLELGRRIEKASRSILLLKNCFLPMPDSPGPVLEVVLEAADSLMTYRSRYMANFQLCAVLDLLLTDETNPRSVAYQIIQIAEHVDQLPRDASQPGYSLEQRKVMSLVNTVRLADIELLASRHVSGEFRKLIEVIHELESGIPGLTQAISNRYLVHTGPSVQLSEIRPKK